MIAGGYDKQRDESKGLILRYLDSRVVGSSAA